MSWTVLRAKKFVLIRLWFLNLLLFWPIFCLSSWFCQNFKCLLDIVFNFTNFNFLHNYVVAVFMWDARKAKIVFRQVVYKIFETTKIIYLGLLRIIWQFFMRVPLFIKVMFISTLQIFFQTICSCFAAWYEAF